MSSDDAQGRKKQYLAPRSFQLCKLAVFPLPQTPGCVERAIPHHLRDQSYRQESNLIGISIYRWPRNDVFAGLHHTMRAKGSCEEFLTVLRPFLIVGALLVALINRLSCLVSLHLSAPHPLRSTYRFQLVFLRSSLLGTPAML